jgi:carboxyl-terminal processing protease
VIELQDGKSALKLTTASYQRPNGHNIHKFPDSKEADEWGVMPNPGFELKLEDEELSELIRHRRERDILRVNHWDPTSQSVKPAAATEATTAPAAEGKDPAAAASEEVKADEAAEAPATESPFVDRQLQKAIDYLTGELAKAS